MMKRLLVFGLGTSLIQILIFYSFIFAIYWVGAAIKVSYPNTSQPEGEYYLLFYVILFPIVVLIQNIVAALIHKLIATYVLMGITIVIYTIDLYDVGSISFKPGLCLASGFVGLPVKTIIDKRMANWFFLSTATTNTIAQL